MNDVWVGVDPGGKDAFGVAIIDESGRTQCTTVSSVSDALNWIIASRGSPRGIGIDAPLWWSAAASGERLVDKRLRSSPKINSVSVQAINSLRGSVLAGGALVALLMREKFSHVEITESHPKALLQWLNLDDAIFAGQFGIENTWGDEHQRDAAVAAVCAREGFQSNWVDLASDRNQFEQDPKSYWLKPVHYWWPELIE